MATDSGILAWKDTPWTKEPGYNPWVLKLKNNSLFQISIIKYNTLLGFMLDDIVGYLGVLSMFKVGEAMMFRSLYCVVCLVAQSCPTLCDPLDYSPPGSSIHGILQARILEWVAIPFSRGSSQPPGIGPRSPSLQVDSLSEQNIIIRLGISVVPLPSQRL